MPPCRAAVPCPARWARGHYGGSKGVPWQDRIFTCACSRDGSSCATSALVVPCPRNTPRVVWKAGRFFSGVGKSTLMGVARPLARNDKATWRRCAFQKNGFPKTQAARHDGSFLAVRTRESNQGRLTVDSAADPGRSWGSSRSLKAYTPATRTENGLTAQRGSAIRQGAPSCASCHCKAP